MVEAVKENKKWDFLNYKIKSISLRQKKERRGRAASVVAETLVSSCLKYRH